MRCEKTARGPRQITAANNNNGAAKSTKKTVNIFYFAGADFNNGDYCFVNLFFFKVCLYFIRNIPFEINIFDLVRVIKGASFGGLVVGIGC